MLSRYLLAPALALAFLISSTVMADELSLVHSGHTYNHNSDAPDGDDMVDAILGETLFQETWYLRGDDGFGGITTLEMSGGTATGNGTDSGSLDFGEQLQDFFGNGIAVEVMYQLSDSAGHAALSYEISLTNNRGDAQDISVFQYFDHDIFGFAGDNLLYDDSGDPTMTIFDDDGNGFTGTVFRTAVGATGFQTGTFGDDIDAAILGGANLDNTNDDVLDSDIAGAFQWDMNIGSGETVVLSGSMFSPVPEPTTALVIAGIMGLGLIRRNRR